MRKEIEIEAADALLDVGVSLPLLRVKIPFRRNPFQIRLTMKRPCLGNQIRIARLYLETGVTHEEMARFNKHEELAYMALHGAPICLLNGLFQRVQSSVVLDNPLAVHIRRLISQKLILPFCNSSV